MVRASHGYRIALLASVLAIGCGTGGGGGPAPTASPLPSASPTPAALDAEGIASLVERVKGAVVNIDTIAPASPDPSASPGEAQPRILIGVGSGFVLRPEGVIVTNYHVVAGVSRVAVRLADGRRLEGRVAGIDPVADLALVRVEASDLPTLPLADPASLRVGQFVMAMGSPDWLEQSVTWGILSAIKRNTGPFARVNFLQTDAPINPGNSGGPLLNMRGEVIGVNSWRLESTVSGRPLQNISFAISTSTLTEVLPQLERGGRVSYPWLGLRVVQDFEGKVYIFQLYEDSPALQAGLKVGDQVLSLNGQPVTGQQGFVDTLVRLRVGDLVTLRIARDGQEQTIEATLIEMPLPTEGPASPTPQPSPS